jgi:hypothetical protein
MPRKLTESKKKTIAGKQSFKCLNTPQSEFEKKYDYECVLWSHPIRKGSFGKEGYEIDHIVEVAEGGKDTEDNLQALCLFCHMVKTKEYLQNKKKKPKAKKETVKKNPSKMPIDKLVKMLEGELYLHSFSGISKIMSGETINLELDDVYVDISNLYFKNEQKYYTDGPPPNVYNVNNYGATYAKNRYNNFKAYLEISFYKNLIRNKENDLIFVENLDKIKGIKSLNKNEKKYEYCSITINGISVHPDSLYHLSDFITVLSPIIKITGKKFTI